MVFYLKYRPKKISELDSLNLREKLESVLKGKLPDNIPHAFLFTGPKGLGKTSTARIVAKAINCTNRKDGEIEPCDKCDSCVSITNGSSLDVLELDAASNRGIDEIRDLREKIRLSPLSSKKKVYIIDEVHMLTTEAFNALLKTLEEPPSHAIFILCTTEPHKVPETIASRCFNIKFIKATDDDLLNSFHRIVKGENLKAEKAALIEIAKLSDGSFRDGAKILEELSTSSSEITEELIEKNYKTASVGKYITDLISSFEKKDAKKGLDIIEKISKENVDFKYFLEELINSLHEALLLEVKENSPRAHIIKGILQLLIKASQDLKYSVLPQLPIEIAIIEWSSEGNLPSKTIESIVKSEKIEVKEKEETLPESRDSSIPTSNNDKILLDLIDGVKKENFSVAGVLRGCKVEKLDKDELTLSTQFKFHKEKLSDKKITDLLENLLEQITKNKMKFSIILK